MIHAHIMTYATDCDGPISRDYVMTQNDEERASEFGDIEFHNRVTAHVVNTFSLHHTGTLDVRRFDNGDVRLIWEEPTEEGEREISALICEKDCDTGETSYRDHRAEEMGY